MYVGVSVKISKL